MIIYQTQNKKKKTKWINEKNIFVLDRHYVSKILYFFNAEKNANKKREEI